MQGVIRKLNKERFSRLDAFLHERIGSTPHAKNIDWIGILEGCRVLVARVTVVLVVTVFPWPVSGKVPFAVMRGGIACCLEHFCDGHLIDRQILADCGGDQLESILGSHGWGGLGPTHPSRAFSRLQTHPSRRTNGSRRICSGKSHSLSSKLFKVRGMKKVALGLGYLIMHGNGQATPALIIGKKEDDVWL